MFRYLLNVLVILSLISSSVFAEKSFQSLWDEEERIGLIADQQAFLKGKHVIFVAGVLNELADLIQNYFPDNINAVKSLGATFSYLAPSSEMSISESALWLTEKINKIAQRIGRPLILVGHSKGAAGILHALLENPEFILEGKVERVLLIQPAIGGSPLADNASGILYSMLSWFLNPNMNTLTPAQARMTFDRAFEQYDKKIEILAKSLRYEKMAIHEHISSRIFYLRSRAEGELSFGLKLVLGVLKDSASRYFSEHDGLLSTDAQFDRRIGVDLGIVIGDHIDLVVSDVSNTSISRREAVTRTAFKQIYLQTPYSIYNERI